MIVESERLLLASISPALARRIVADEREDDWHPDYPLDDELVPLAALGRASDPDPVFTMYVVRRRSDGLAIGGIGFFGPPAAEGRVEFGYGLVRSARNVGFATEAVVALIDLAACNGARTAVADTAPENVASQRVLDKAGFAVVSRDESGVFFQRSLAEGWKQMRRT